MGVSPINWGYEGVPYKLGYEGFPYKSGVWGCPPYINLMEAVGQDKA
jgi:hypothetical protein